MGFVDKKENSLINDEQKIRITLSNRAQLIMAEDMEVFKTRKASAFINTVFTNYRNEAKSSINLYLQQRELELDRLLSNVKLDDASKKLVINQLKTAEENILKEKINGYLSLNGESKLYHINNSNVNYLVKDCEENEQDGISNDKRPGYKRPGDYIRCVVEEYCSLPFIKRERIYRKEIYDSIEQACKEKRILKVKTIDQLVFYVYPYKIVSDPFQTQSYLVCYSRKENEEDKDKIVASFSMARINKPTTLVKTFHLNKQEISNIDHQISKYSAAYLVGKSEKIKVKLTENGKQLYQSRLYSRPEIESRPTDDVYVFDCTPKQIYNFFFSFGADAEIISPDSLRDRFKNELSKALDNYK